MNPSGAAAGGPQNMPAPSNPCTAGATDIVNNVFGIVVPGRPLLTQFKQAGPTKFLTEIQEPSTAGELTIFLQPGQTLPPDKGIAIYWSYPPFTEWLTLGTVPPNQASEILTTGWPHLPELRQVPAVQVGVSIEDAGVISNLDQAFGRESFSQTTPEGERLVLPMSALENWLKRFEDKYRADPNFLTNQS